jgi:gamma-polyglutamate biosynthesis protein CapC
MDTFILHIFPDSGLASSLITTVWIGVFVVCFFNLRFGWNLSGLIVPGYLVPLLILKPWSATAIIIEAVFTYFLVVFFSEFSSKIGHWSSLFGRDRFFAIILFSVISRLLFDCILFPELTVFLNNYFHVTFVYKGGLYSIGLVIVALIANQFWNPGIKRGLPQFLITLFISFLLIRYILLEYTNFRISEVAYLYEDIATSLAASPKAYIIFIITAFLASRMNLLYGWEFGGIVLPALLALQWYYPWKIISSILEAGIIYGLAVLVLRMPLFKNITIEGARKILLFFNIAFAYKMLIGFLLPLIIPDVKILNVYGLGYMLTSLIAIKMYDKKIGLKMTRMVLQTSLLAIILATIVGFALQYVPSLSNMIKGTKNAYDIHNKYHDYDNISEAVLQEQIRLYGFLRKAPPITQEQLMSFRNSIKALKEYVKSNSNLFLQYAAAQLDHLGYKLDIIDDGYILLYEKNEQNSRGIYIIAINPQNNILAVIPVSTQGPGLLESVMLAVVQQNFAALAIAGGKNTLPDQLQDYLVNNDSFYNIFCDVFNSKPTIQFFRQDEYIKNLLPKNNRTDNVKSKKKYVPEDKDYVYYSDSMTAQDLKIVSSFFPKLDRIKQTPSFIKNNKNVITIFLTLKTELNTLTEKGKFDLSIPHIKGKNIAAILSEKKGFFDASISAITKLFVFKKGDDKQKNKPLTIEKARFIDTQVLTPIINLTNEHSILSKDEKENRIKLISFAARIAGCSVGKLTIQSINGNYIVLKGFRDNKDEYLGGTFVFKTSDHAAYTVEVIDPSNKNNFKLGVYLAAYLKARACFISGSFKRKDFFSYTDDTPTVRSLFNLANQVIMRETDILKSATKKNKTCRSTIVQICTIPNTDKTLKYFPNSIYFTTYYGKFAKSQLTKQEKIICNFLEKYNLKVLSDDGSPKTAGLAAIHSLQARYLTQTANIDFVLLWLPPSTYFNVGTSKKIESQVDIDSNKKKASDNQLKNTKNHNSKKLNKNISE